MEADQIIDGDPCISETNYNSCAYLIHIPCLTMV